MKRKIIESLVDEMVKDAFYSLGSDKTEDERPETCLNRGIDGSSIATSIVEDVLDKAVCSLNEISEYKMQNKTYSESANQNSEGIENRNYYVWQTPKPTRSLKMEASNSSLSPDSSQIIRDEKSQELNFQPNNVHIVCDICCQNELSQVFLSETDLKTHTLKMHINPLFISPSDLSDIGGMSEIKKAYETKLTAIDLEKLQNDTTHKIEITEKNSTELQSHSSSVSFFWFRCHVCFLLFNAKHSLSIHLSNNHSVQVNRGNEGDEGINDQEETLPLSLRKKQSGRRKNGSVVDLSMQEEMSLGKNRRRCTKNTVQLVQPSSSFSRHSNGLKVGRRCKYFLNGSVATSNGTDNILDLEESQQNDKKT